MRIIGGKAARQRLRVPKGYDVRPTPDLVKQEFYGFMMAHYAVRGLMHEAALKADEDPDRLSFLHAVRVIRRKLPAFDAIPPSTEDGLS